MSVSGARGRQPTDEKKPDHPVLRFTISRLGGCHVGVEEIAQAVQFQLSCKSYRRRPLWFHYIKSVFPPHLVMLRINCTERHIVGGFDHAQ